MDRELAAEVRAVLQDVLERGGATWQACAEAGLLALAAPAEHGGEDLGLPGIAVLVREAAAKAADLPFAETLACGLLPILRCGTPEQQAELVAPIVSGELVLAPAIAEPGDALPPAPATRLEGERLHGRKVGVPVLEGDRVLLVVTATGPEGHTAVLIDPGEGGVGRTETVTSSGVAEATYTFEGVAPVAVLGTSSGELVLACAVAASLERGAGLLAGARDLTAGYVTERIQFGRKLAEFQGVALQIADVYVAARLAGLAADEVTRRVTASRPALGDAAVGAHWLAGRGIAALQTCHHLHGGMGVDETYPLHRYFSRLKDLSRALGGAAGSLALVDGTASPANLELTAGQRAFKDEVRAYFADLVAPEDRLEMMTDRHGPAYHRTIKQMGSDGWMGVGWPVEYGGKGLGGIEQQVFANEAARADVHLPSVTLQTVGPTLQAFGTEKQKEMFLKDILTGDVHFAIGYSEADAGTDLASLRCSARKDPATGDWIVNGQKMWTTGGHAADYVWLAVRTDPDAPKHKGISVLIVDTKDPGYSWTPIVTCEGSHHVNATAYDDVRVPADMLVGEENEGWRLITTQLNHERVMLGPAGRIEGLRDLVVAWARDRTAPDGTPVLGVPWVRDVLARATVSFRLNELLNWHVAAPAAAHQHGAWGTTTGTAAVADSSASKVFASDEVQSIGIALEQVVTTYGDLADEATATLAHYLDATSKRNLVLTFGGGVNEVQRELIAMFGLGLPKVPR